MQNVLVNYEMKQSSKNEMKWKPHPQKYKFRTSTSQHAYFYCAWLAPSIGSISDVRLMLSMKVDTFPASLLIPLLPSPTALFLFCVLSKNF